MTKNRVYYNPQWMYDQQLAILFMCQVPQKFNPKSPEDLEPYQESRLVSLLEEAFKAREPVMSQLEDKLNLDLTATNPLSIARAIIQTDNWQTYLTASQNLPKGQSVEALDQKEWESLFQQSDLLAVLEQLQTS